VERWKGGKVERWKGGKETRVIGISLFQLVCFSVI
jgi:hypothetical protein